MIAEVLELAGNASKDLKSKRISPRHILLAIRGDQELDEFSNDACIIDGGVIPYIHKSLIAKKGTKSPFGGNGNPRGFSGAALPAFGQSNSGFGQSNSSFGQASSGFGQSNSGFGQASSGFGQASSGFGQASSAFGQSSSAFGSSGFGGAARPSGLFGK